MESKFFLLVLSQSASMHYVILIARILPNREQDALNICVMKQAN